MAALAQLWPRFASYYWLRLSLFCAWAAYGVVPTAHFVILNGGLGRLVPDRVIKIGCLYFVSEYYIYFLRSAWICLCKIKAGSKTL